MRLFGVVQVYRTSSNLLEPHHRRDSKVCTVLSQEFGVVRLYRTFSNFIFTGETRCAGCSCTSSGWFKRIESPRTFSNHIIAEIARCVEFFHRSSEWFDCTEPSRTTSVQGKQVCRVLMHQFGLVQAYRTSSNHIIAEIARCVEFFHMSSGSTSLQGNYIFTGETTSLQGKPGLQGAYALVWGGSSASNLLEPSQPTASQR